MGSITLRPLKSNDAEYFMTWGGDPLVTHSLFWDHYTDVEVARKFLKEIAEAHPWFMAICLDGTPIGAITLDQGKFRASKRAELGYVLAKKYWGKGFATEAVSLALKKGFADLELIRIDAYVDPENLGSIKVLERNKFLREGHLSKYVIHRGQIRDRFIYAFFP